MGVFILIAAVFLSMYLADKVSGRRKKAESEESIRARQIGNAVGLLDGDIEDAVIVDYALRRSKGRTAADAATAAAMAAAILDDD